MGFNINETIKTELHYKDIALIAVALGEYQDRCKDEKFIKHARDLVNRLGREMYDCPQDDDD